MGATRIRVYTGTLTSLVWQRRQTAVHRLRLPGSGRCEPGLLPGALQVSTACVQAQPDQTHASRRTSIFDKPIFHRV